MELSAGRPQAKGGGENDHAQDNGKARTHLYSLQRIRKPITRVMAATICAPGFKFVNGGL